MPTQTTHPVLREDLDPRPHECLACYLDRMLARHDCTTTWGLTRWWQLLRSPRATTLASRLSAMGATCDCEVLTTVYEPAPALVSRRAGAWDRPACAGVRNGSAQPCAAWRRRARWQ